MSVSIENNTRLYNANTIRFGFMSRGLLFVKYRGRRCESIMNNPTGLKPYMVREETTLAKNVTIIDNFGDNSDTYGGLGKWRRTHAMKNVPSSTNTSVTSYYNKSAIFLSLRTSMKTGRNSDLRPVFLSVMSALYLTATILF